ncbi:MAG TPA: hypothetical protein VGG13_03320 [Candidatus Saccharimonadales bacterium]|jgi:hypothetical protein
MKVYAVCLMAATLVWLSCKIALRYATTTALKLSTELWKEQSPLNQREIMVTVRMRYSFRKAGTKHGGQMNETEQAESSLRRIGLEKLEAYLHSGDTQSLMGY